MVRKGAATLERAADTRDGARMLAGRDLELSALDALFRDCAAGKGTTVVLGGPVGSGKTALLHVLADRAAAAGTCLVATASRAEKGLPLGVLRQLFQGCSLPAALAKRAAALIDDSGPHGRLPGAPEPDAVSRPLARVFEGLFELVAELADRGPLLLAVDDSQHADAASLHCISYLARRTRGLPVLTALAEGAHPLPVDRSLRAEILRQGNCHCIPVRPLPPSSVAELLTGYLGAQAGHHLAPACHAMTGGSPLLVRAVAADTSASSGEAADGLFPGAAFGSAVVTCLHRYDQETVELGYAVAILGRAAPAGLFAELLATSPGSVAARAAALESSGLLGSGYFRHEQAREAVLSHMTDGERAAMHARVARALHLGGAAPATVARHLMPAARIGARWTVAALREAAAQAVADGKTDRAIEYLRRAETECADERERAGVRLALAGAEFRIDPERASRRLPELAAWARGGLLDGECLGELALYLLWMGNADAAAEVLARSGAGYPQAGRGDGEHGRSRGILSSPLEFLYPEAVGRVYRSANDRSAKPTAEADPGLLPNLDGSGVATAAAERILSDCEASDPTLASVTTALLTLVCEDMLDRASSWCDVILRESAGRPLWRAVLTGFLAMIEARRGNLPAAESHALRALSLLSTKAWGVAIGGPLSSLLFAATASRRFTEATAYLRTPVPDAMFGTIHGMFYLHARGEYYLATGHPRSALADFSDCGRRMARWGLDLPGLIPWRTKAAEAHLAMGDGGKARELSTEQLEQAGSRAGRARGISLRALALASHPAKQTALLRESAEFLRDSGARLELAYTLAELSKAHQSLGEEVRAQRMARQALELAERCGAQVPTATLSTVNASQRGPGDKAAPTAVTQLSDAEQRVAALAAFGYTNGQIAHKLYITVSTVEQHLTRVYRKLGIAGRAELPIGI
jgi:DNA-binding CsgD family transcriptional regulator